MSSCKDLTGKKFGRLTVMYKTDRRDSAGGVLWHCRCDCGNERDVSSTRLRCGSSQSCGCYNRERVSEACRSSLAGKRFGWLTALYPTDKRNSSGLIFWHCKCDCGNEVDIPSASLVSGNSKSCGCIRRIAIMTANQKFFSDDERRISDILIGMKQRCYNSNNSEYRNYGARGITVCDEWLANSKNFVDWALSHGYQSGLSIDRIDVNGPYAPWNCRWATRREQNMNKRTNVYLTVNGIRMTITEWAEKIGVSIGAIKWYLNRYDTEDKAVEFIRSKITPIL